jgi:hypothetical protein
MIAATLGDMPDFFDYFLIGYVPAYIVHDWDLTHGQTAMIRLAAGVGAVPRRLRLGLGGRQNRPAQGVHRHRTEYLGRHRHHGADAR